MIEVYYAEDDEMIGKSVKEYLEHQNCKVSVFNRIVDVRKALILSLIHIWNKKCKNQTLDHNGNCSGQI